MADPPESGRPRPPLLLPIIPDRRMRPRSRNENRPRRCAIRSSGMAWHGPMGGCRTRTGRSASAPAAVRIRARLCGTTWCTPLARTRTASRQKARPCRARRSAGAPLCGVARQAGGSPDPWTDRSGLIDNGSASCTELVRFPWTGHRGVVGGCAHAGGSWCCAHRSH